jgi:hypothetical protein
MWYLLDIALFSYTDKKQPSITIEENPIQIAIADEVEPTFKTPCRYIMVGTIELQV